MIRLSRLLLAAVLALWAVTGTAHAAARCGQTITSDVVLTRSLVCPGDGLIVAAGDVTVDLGGHAVRGAGTGTGILVRPCGATGEVVVRHGVVSHFGTGVQVAVEPDCEQEVTTTVERLTVTANGAGVRAAGFGSVGPVVVRGSRIADNAGNGITAAFVRPFTVVANDIARNGGTGVAAFDDSIDRFVANVVRGNGADGAAFQDSVATIDANLLARNGGAGLIVRERFCGLKQRYEVADNLAFSNAGGGMSATFLGCVDPAVPPPGADNVARFNASFQCVLIVCGTNGKP